MEEGIFCSIGQRAVIEDILGCTTSICWLKWMFLVSCSKLISKLPLSILWSFCVQLNTFFGCCLYFIVYNANYGRIKYYELELFPFPYFLSHQRCVLDAGSQCEMMVCWCQYYKLLNFLRFHFFFLLPQLRMMNFCNYIWHFPSNFFLHIFFSSRYYQKKKKNFL